MALPIPKNILFCGPAAPLTFSQAAELSGAGWHIQLIHTLEDLAAASQPVDLLLLHLSPTGGTAWVDAALQLLALHPAPLIVLAAQLDAACAARLRDQPDLGFLPAEAGGPLLLTAVQNARDSFAARRQPLHDLDQRVQQRTAELEAANLALRESEENYRLLFDNMQEGFSLHEMILDEHGQGVDFRFLACNRAYERHTGMKPEEVVGRSLLEVLPGASRQQIAAYSRVAQTGEPLDFEYYSQTFQRHLRVRAFSPQKGRFAAIFEDITERKLAEQALHESEEKNRVLFDNEVYAISIADQQSMRLLDVNAAFVNMYGYSREELLAGMTLLDISAEVQASTASINQTIQNGAVFVPVRRNQRKDGSLLPVEIVGGPYTWQGKPVLFSLFHDISARLQVEEALRESEDRLREVLENSLDASYKRNLLTNTYDYLSPAFRQISGYTPEEMKNLPLETVLDLMHPDDLLEIEFVIAESMIGPRGSSYQVDYRFKHKDGHYRWFHDQFIVMEDGQGQPSALIGSLSDITERKRVEEMLNISETRYRRLFETTKDGVLILEEETGKIIDVNPFLIELLGYSPEQFLEKEIWEIGFFRDIAANRDKFLELQQKQFVRYEDLPLETADGRKIHVEFVSNVYLVKDKKVIQCNIRDTTARKEAEEKIRSLNIELEQLASTDGLTGILNHRSLLKFAEHEFDVAMRYQPPLSMLFFDIDYFKPINDTFGHAMGDQALKKTIHTVCAELRSADLIGRYGGDEFVILLPRTPAQDALPLAERIHARIAAMSLDTGKGPLTLTISIGIAQTIHETSQTDTVESLLQRADQALYAAKQAGRNRTVVFGSETMG